jgi:biotin carboxylase
MALARHAFQTVAAHLHAHADFYRELLARHGVRITPTRLGNDLETIAAAGADAEAVQAALVADGARHSAPAGLDHTLAELERLLSRIEGARV